jgi:hypothetical protein
MTALKDKKGMILFGVIAAVLLVCAIVAFQVTGPLGIEERFGSATGSSAQDENGEVGGGIAGFSLEGNALLYIFIIAALVLVCIILYRKYRL